MRRGNADGGLFLSNLKLVGQLSSFLSQYLPLFLDWHVEFDTVRRWGGQLFKEEKVVKKGGEGRESKWSINSHFHFKRSLIGIDGSIKKYCMDKPFLDPTLKRL